MNEITNLENYGVLQVSEKLLDEVRTDTESKDTLKMPITELSLLGAGVSSLIPSLHTITQTTSLNTSGKLYQLANQGVGDVLKAAKDGTNWGAFKTSAGKSKMVKLKEVTDAAQTTATTVPVDPATMMMAVALYQIEKEVAEISKEVKNIMTFLELNKESDIEGDLETINQLIKEYKYSWDNEVFVNGHYNEAIAVKGRARSNMNYYKKNVNAILDNKQLIVTQNQVSSTVESIIKNMKYFRLSLYTFAMSSFVEILLCGNFKDEFIQSIKDEVQSRVDEYNTCYNKAYKAIEKMSKSSLDTNVLKGASKASKALGNFIGSVPFVKEGQVDEFLVDSSEGINKFAADVEEGSVKALEEISSPNTQVFIDKMDDFSLIYNHTKNIYFDEENIYLTA